MQQRFHKQKNLYKKNWFLDAIIVVLLLVVGFIISYTEISNYRMSGKKQDFYQIHFEPAVSMACGKGFVVHTPSASFREPYLIYLIKPTDYQETPLSQFLKQKRDYLDCSELPRGVMLQENPPQQLWYYLISTVGVIWKVTGISWPVVDKLVAFLFSLSIAISYGIFRLGMGRFLAVILSLLLCGSALHLNYLPWMRDYSKAPFMLAVFFFLGLFVRSHSTQFPFLILSAILGLIVGIGYGYRVDLLITFPIIFFTILFFLPNTISYFKKITASAILVSTFLVSAYPVLLMNDKTGNGGFEQALQGLMLPFNKALKIEKSPIYEIGHQYNDFLSSTLIGAHADHFLHLDLDKYMTSPTSTFNFATKNYDQASYSLAKYIIKMFPGDILTRAYASAQQVLNLGFCDWQANLLISTNNFANLFYKHSRPVLGVFQNYGAELSLLAIFCIAIFKMRIAIFLLVFIVYFASYPGIQFDPRHFFYLEFISLWVLGFLVYQVFCFKKNKQLIQKTGKKIITNCILAGLFITSVCIIGPWLLTIARAIQTKNLLALNTTYESSEKHLLTKSSAKRDNDAQLINVDLFKNIPVKKYYSTGKMLLIEFGDNECNKEIVDFTIEYDFDKNLPSPFNFSKQDSISIVKGQKSLVFTPIFQGPYFRFKGISVKNEQSHCVGNIYEVDGLENYPLWLFLKLPFTWREQRLYQILN
jgi:hypothetical protein